MPLRRWLSHRSCVTLVQAKNNVTENLEFQNMAELYYVSSCAAVLSTSCHSIWRRSTEPPKHGETVRCVLRLCYHVITTVCVSCIRQTSVCTHTSIFCRRAYSLPCHTPTGACVFTSVHFPNKNVVSCVCQHTYFHFLICYGFTKTPTETRQHALHYIVCCAS